jgi:hypothetical protein
LRTLRRDRDHYPRGRLDLDRLAKSFYRPANDKSVCPSLAHLRTRPAAPPGRRGRDRLDDVRYAPVIMSLLPRTASEASPCAAPPVIPTSAAIVAPNSAFVIARTTTIVIPRSGHQAGTDDTGTIAVRSPPVVSTSNAGNAQGGQRSTDLRLSTLDRQRR